jgi:hypothetical protein
MEPVKIDVVIVVGQVILNVHHVKVLEMKNVDGVMGMDKVLVVIVMEMEKLKLTITGII